MKLLAKHDYKKSFGQYFTPNIIAEFMIEMANISPNSNILEPSCGEGIFLELLQKKGYSNITAYEIDRTLGLNFNSINYESFVSATIDKKFDLVIGNPPYIRWKNLLPELKEELSANPIWNKYFNALCDYLYIFIVKSIELLNENGQLIFICPEYWLNTTHAINLRNYMVQNGYFEQIFHFNETPIFDKVAISTIIFKFIKSKKNGTLIKVTKFYNSQKLTADTLNLLKQSIFFKGVEYLTLPQFKLNERWLLQPNEIQHKLFILEKNCIPAAQSLQFDLFKTESLKFNTIGDYCDIGNGLVSGLDKAFQLNEVELTSHERLAIIAVAKAKDLQPFRVLQTTKYIFLSPNLDESTLKNRYPNFYKQLQYHKIELENRYQYKKKINYWEWVFLRNLALFSKNEQRIFVPCKERISHKNYFRFALAEANIFPTQDVTGIFKKPTTQESIEYILAYLNLPIIFDWLKCNGIVKGNIVEFSEKPLASIPFRAINFFDKQEVAIHDTITMLTKQYLENQDHTILDAINNYFNQLFEKQHEYKL